jgi:hypothetical protein
VTPGAAVVTRPLATVRVRFLAALVTVAVLLLLACVGAPPAAAAPAATVPPPTPSGPLTLELAQLTPRVVTADGPTAVTVVGTLRNTGERRVDALEIRLQRGAALGTDGDARDALAGTGRVDAVTPAFTALPGILPPGAALPVQLSVPLRGAPTAGLALDRPGVYEVLVNVNGVPDAGGRARLAAVRLLLPVLSLPAGPDPVADPAVPVASGSPTADLTVLFPLVDAPRRLPTVPGEQTLLTDDDLARSLAPDGRLGGLLATFTERAPPGSPVRAATCLAVDPDLVATAAAMRQGYAVRGPTGTVVPGTGANVAGAWLDRLAATARNGCIVALPFADADLVALARGNLGDLGQLAVADGRTVVAQTLGVDVPAITWPVDGVLDDGALAGVAAGGGRAVVLVADTVTGPSGGGTVPLSTDPAAPVTAVLADPLLTRAAAEPDTSATATVAGAVTTAPAAATPPLATQDGLATLVFRTQTRPPGSAPLVLTPPHQWTADAVAAGALLDTVRVLLDADRLRPRGLASLSSGPTAPGPARRLADPLQIGTRDIPTAVVDAVRELHTDVTDLQSAAVAETGVGAPIDATFTPLREAALRPTSSAWHGRPDLAAGAARAAGIRVGELRDSVRVLQPPGPYSLGTSDAPLLLTVANGLPVTMEVRLTISSTTGLRVAPIPVQRIPPLGRRQVQVSAEVVRSGQFAVEATVRTPAGRPLGPPSRLQVRSTAYGTITLWLTGCAGVLLVVLSAYRVVRRLRGEPSSRGRTAPAPEPAPEGAAPLHDGRASPVPTPTDADLPTRPVPTPPDPEPPTRPVPARPR